MIVSSPDSKVSIEYCCMYIYYESSLWSTEGIQTPSVWHCLFVPRLLSVFLQNIKPENSNSTQQIPLTGAEASDQPEVAIYRQPKSNLPPRKKKAIAHVPAPIALQRYRHVELRPGMWPGRGPSRARASPRPGEQGTPRRLPQIPPPAETAASRSSHEIKANLPTSKEDEEAPR